jgi:septum formation protein
MVIPALPPLVLASVSPRRRELLHGLGLDFEVDPADINEGPAPGEDAASLVQRLALAKAARCRERHGRSLVLAADTVVVTDGPAGEELLGKPKDPGEAYAMLRLLSGRRHQVLTGMALAGPGGARAQQLARTQVTFLPLSEALIDWYVSTGEAYDKAGAYGVQGCAALFVSRLEGSWTNVVGLPLDLLEALFRDAGQELSRYLVAGER